jgi:hypothetical protein
MNERMLRRIGHKGADLLAPGNTAASFDAALDTGVDMIEFDVLPEPPPDWRTVSVGAAERRTYPDGRLLLAHDWRDASERNPQTLEEGLAHLASERFAGIELDIDLKLPGYELRVLDALRDAGLLDRALLSSQYRHSLRLIRRAEPSAPARPVPPSGAVSRDHPGAARVPGGAACARRPCHPRRRMRRDHGALAARDARAATCGEARRR